jgi:hypothetical protein
VCALEHQSAAAPAKLLQQKQVETIHEHIFSASKYIKLRDNGLAKFLAFYTFKAINLEYDVSICSSNFCGTC